MACNKIPRTDDSVRARRTELKRTLRVEKMNWKQEISVCVSVCAKNGNGDIVKSSNGSSRQRKDRQVKTIYPVWHILSVDAVRGKHFSCDSLDTHTPASQLTNWTVREPRERTKSALAVCLCCYFCVQLSAKCITIPYKKISTLFNVHYRHDQRRKATSKFIRRIILR